MGIDKDHIMDSCLEFLDLLWYGRNVKKWSEENLGLMVMTAWGIWTNLNEVRHGKSGKPATVLAWWTKNYLEEYLTANHDVRPYREPVEECGSSLNHPGTRRIWTMRHLNTKKRLELELLFGITMVQLWQR